MRASRGRMYRQEKSCISGEKLVIVAVGLGIAQQFCIYHDEPAFEALFGPSNAYHFTTN
jgi:hypothetical protein